MKENLKNSNGIDSHIEAILFLKGEPMSIKQLAKILEMDEEKVGEAVDVLRENLLGRGICLVKKENSVALATSPESSKFTKILIKGEFDSQLTKASLETLSIVVYRGPVSRSEIDYIRGVNSTFILRNLLIKGLVERVSNPCDSRSYLYKPSFLLLQYLGIQNIEELPEYNNFNETVKKFIKENGNKNEQQKENIGGFNSDN
ncbi:MAG TPA: SMC-Scp complex subunit ScpB [bacterium]|nr:SMC-Scp complex subunit ScpB [bacterium]